MAYVWPPPAAAATDAAPADAAPADAAPADAAPADAAPADSGEATRVPSAAASEKDVEADAADPANAVAGANNDKPPHKRLVIKAIGGCILIAGLAFAGYAIYRYAWIPHHKHMLAQNAAAGTGVYGGAGTTGTVKTSKKYKTTKTVTVTRTRAGSTVDYEARATGSPAGDDLD